MGLLGFTERRFFTLLFIGGLVINGFGWLDSVFGFTIWSVITLRTVFALGGLLVLYTFYRNT